MLSICNDGGSTSRHEPRWECIFWGFVVVRTCYSDEGEVPYGRVGKECVGKGMNYFVMAVCAKVVDCNTYCRFAFYVFDV